MALNKPATRAPEFRMNRCFQNPLMTVWRRVHQRKDTGPGHKYSWWEIKSGVCDPVCVCVCARTQIMVNIKEYAGTWSQGKFEV